MIIESGNIFVRTRKRFMDFKISTKIMLFYFIVLIFSVVLSSVLYQNIYSNIMSDKVSDVSMQTLYSINSNIDSMIENSKNLSKVIITSDEIQQPLKSRKNPYREEINLSSGQDTGIKSIMSVDLDAQRTINAHISKFIEAFPFISSIYIFDNNSERYGIDKLPLKSLKNDGIKEAEWYNDAVNAQGGYILRLNAGDVFENKTGDKYISLIRIINDVYSQKPIGVLILNISENSFVDSYKDIINKYDTDIMIIDGKGQGIVNFRNPVKLDINKILQSSSGKNSIVEKLGTKDYLISHLNIQKYDWNIISMMPFDELSKESSIFSAIAFFVITINSFLLFLGSLVVSRMITTPIKKLLRSMKGVEKGEFKKVDIVTGNNEIGKLRDGYNIMISEIQNLINRVVEDQKVKRKAELDVLQAQIKPHFLYNTFDAISSLALSGRNDEVYKVMKALGSYYRISLSKGSEVITIGEEVEVVKNYLTIQQVRYGEIFDVKYNIDERAKKFKILKLVLQPLVENALYHGIKPKGEKGTITISVRYFEEAVVITIEDDGVGMEEEDIHRIIEGSHSDKKTSFGLKGTIERLRIFYSEKDLFMVESTKDLGTKVIINIPVRGENENVC